ncbi:MAG TPA: hypothetical protein VG841_07490 [Caulobacterales bacterium]|nr:hypothetical protein [Caulobacterales bacterium]
MLVLLNLEMIDVGDPLATLRELGMAEARPIGAAKLVALGQEAAFSAGALENAHPAIRRALAAFMGLGGEANCALFLAPPGARTPRDVAVRLGLAPITTMAFLLSAQQAGKLNAAMINAQVWRLADAPNAA